jgi:ABC-type lipoprotein release transport system permease subunit
MKTAIKIAYRNLIGAGLRTWLNVIVLSFSFVVIIWLKGIMTGWDYQAKTDMIHWQIGQGQYWHENYDTYNPYSLQQSHAAIPEAWEKQMQHGNMTASLIIQGSVFPQGRMMSVLLQGINPEQDILKLPTQKLLDKSHGIPAIIGFEMANNMQLEVGDYVSIRWRDANGVFDATDIYIAEVFSCNVPSVEAGKIYLALNQLQEMAAMEGEATVFTIGTEELGKQNREGWIFKSKDELTKAIDEMIQTKTAGQSVFYAILLLLAMLAIFDTQVLSIFRRQKEIGTYVALGYTRRQVVGLFTIEGAMHSILAAIVAAIYGIPFLLWQAKAGWTMPIDTSEFGLSIAQTLYPKYSFQLVVGTTLLIVVVTTIVSYWPARKIAKMNPTEALRGKIQ